MKTAAAALGVSALFVISARALDADQIREFAEQPHSREGLIPELKIYPDGREYEIEHDTTDLSRDRTATMTARADEKVVDGKYVVTTITGPELPGSIIMAVTFDGESQSYIKTVLLPNGNVAESRGVAIPGQRSIAFASKHSGDADFEVLTIEVHGNDESSWREMFMRNGKPYLIVDGKATKTK